MEMLQDRRVGIDQMGHSPGVGLPGFLDEQECIETEQDTQFCLRVRGTSDTLTAHIQLKFSEKEGGREAEREMTT